MDPRYDVQALFAEKPVLFAKGKVDHFGWIASHNGFAELDINIYKVIVNKLMEAYSHTLLGYICSLSQPLAQRLEPNRASHYTEEVGFVSWRLTEHTDRSPNPIKLYRFLF